MKQLARINLETNYRAKHLRKLLKTRPIVRLLEAHNGLTGLIVENTHVLKDDKIVEFDAIWESSLTDSISKGKPDIAVVDMTSRIQTIHEILDVTTKPMVVDANNGGLTEIFGFTVRSLERIGVSAVVIEDKVDEKRNSLFGTEVAQKQDSIENFSKKIAFGKASQQTEDFMIIARIESLILKQGMEDAIKRAKAYISAGADGILIHSKEKTTDEVLEFCQHYKNITSTIPLVVVPTNYSSVRETELINAGVKVVIYANHLLRSAYPAMTLVAEQILNNQRSLESNEHCLPVDEILRLIPFSETDG
jgi:phosphoenolpyruvate mutase